MKLSESYHESKEKCKHTTYIIYVRQNAYYGMHKQKYSAAQSHTFIDVLEFYPVHGAISAGGQCVVTVALIGIGVYVQSSDSRLYIHVYVYRTRGYATVTRIAPRGMRRLHVTSSTVTRHLQCSAGISVI